MDADERQVAGLSVRLSRGELEAAYERLDEDEKPYARRREELIRRAGGREVGCRDCVRLASSLYCANGELRRFRRACRIRRWEDRKGIRSERDYARWTWRLGRWWRGEREPGFSMRGAGGRKREFERWMEEAADELGVEVPQGDPGRRGPLETVSGPEVDFPACLEVLEQWTEHLRGVDDPVEHVDSVLRPTDHERALRDPSADLDLPAESRPVRPTLMQAAARGVEELKADRRRTSRALAGRLLAGLSDGLLTPRQLLDLIRT